MTLELTLDEIRHLAHCAEKMRNLAEKSRVIAEALDIDDRGRQRLRTVTAKITHQAEKYLRNSPPATHNSQLP